MNIYIVSYTSLKLANDILSLAGVGYIGLAQNLAATLIYYRQH